MGFAGHEGRYAAGVYELARGLLDALDAVKVNDRTSRETALHPLLNGFAAAVKADAERLASERGEQTIKGLREQLDAATNAKTLAWDHYAAAALSALIIANAKRKPKRQRLHDELVTEARQLAELLAAEAEGRHAR